MERDTPNQHGEINEIMRLHGIEPDMPLPNRRARRRLAAAHRRGDRRRRKYGSHTK